MSAADGEGFAIDPTQVRAWKRYPAYKDSGVEWLGEVPAGWEIKRLKHISTVNDDTLSENTPSDYRLLYVDISNVDPIEGIQNIEEMTFENSPSRARRIVQSGDVIVSTVRTYLQAITPIIDPPENLIVSTGFAVIRANSNFDSKFAGYTLRGSHFIESVVARSTGVSYPAINASELVSLKIPLPPLPEQHAIAAFLDRETVRIDALIEKKQRFIELLEEKRQALISHAVTKGLDPDVEMKDSGVEWIGEVPAGWEVVKTKYVASLHSGHTPSRSHPEYWEDCTIPWFSLADVWQLREGRREYLGETKEKISQLGLANSAAELLPAGTVIVSRTASVGFSGIMPEPMATTQDFVNWVCDRTKILPEYLLYVFRSMKQEFERLRMGSTHKTIYMPDVAAFQTPLPPLDEQRRIVAYVQEKKAIFDQLEDKSIESVEKLGKYRTALISAAVTGKIDVRGEGGAA